MSEDQETTQGDVKAKITHDFILDVYETSIAETNPDIKKSIISACKVLADNIGTYLVDVDKKDSSS